MHPAEFLKRKFILIETEQILHDITKKNNNNSGKNLSNSRAYTNTTNNKL
jgi:hypothetical protein